MKQVRARTAYIGVATTCVVLMLAACQQGVEPIAELRSPNGRYSVSLKGSVSTPSLPLVYARVTASAMAEKPLCTGFQLFEADFFDRAFFDMYARPTWISENAFAFQGQSNAVSERLDRVIVRNDSPAPIPCLQIIAFDMLLVLDVRPKAQLVLPLSRQPEGPVYFSATMRGSGEKNVFAETSFDRAAHPGRELIPTVVIDPENRVKLSVDVGTVKASEPQ